jgi:hypothetical protein
MKKVIFGLITSLALFNLVSCSNNNEIEETASNKRISQVLNEKNYATQKIMYSLLNEEEKFKIWNDKIENILQKNNLTKEQSDLIYELKNNISLNLFKDGERNDEREIFKTIFVKNFLKKTVNVFTEDFIVNNFYYLSENSARTVFGNADDLADCTCNIGSMWSCSGSFECKETDKCADTTSGCGFLTFFECTGRCFLY